MAESINESGNFTPDLFSPLQFCEVVEEGQQHQHRQQLQLHRHHSQLAQQLNSQVQQPRQTSNPHHQQSHEQQQQQQQTHHQHQNQSHGTSQSHPHQQTAVVPQQQQQMHQQPSHQPQQQTLQQQQQQQQQSQQNQDSTSHQHQQQASPHQPQHQHQSVVKQEVSQSSHQLLDSQNGVKCISSMEIFLATPVSDGLPAQPVPVVSLQQHQPITQHLYQMQLNRQQQQLQQQLQLNSLQLQSNPQLQIEQHLQSAISEATVVDISTVESFALPISSAQIVSPPTTAAVASQATQTDQPSVLEDDEPEIIFSSATKSSPNGGLSGKSAMLNGASDKCSLTTKSACEVKPIPIKKTWRRPWKRKKEREKRQPVKKSRRVKRKRIIVPKKSAVHIDPRNGPPIDTSRTVVQRQSEEQINQLKQKRQRIKLNRNSGREYVNRLGKIVSARKIGSPCNCPLKCWDRMGSKILDIFNNFWDLCDFNLQNSYLFTCLKLCDVKRRYTKKQPAEESRRQNTFEYFVRIAGKHFRVCKKAFMSSHGLTSDKRLRTLFTQMKDGALIPEPDRRGKHLRPNKPSAGPGSQSQTTNQVESFNNITAKISTKTKNRSSKKRQQHQRMEANKQTMYAPPPSHAVSHIHPPPPPPPPAHGTNMQEPPHAYIPNGDIYFPGHYLEPPQAMAPPHMNQIPSCQKMLEAPAYFMAGMKENTFHQ